MSGVGEKSGLNWRALVAGLVIALMVAWFSARPGVQPGANSEAGTGDSRVGAGAALGAAGPTSAERRVPAGSEAPTAGGLPAPAPGPAPPRGEAASAPTGAASPPPAHSPRLERPPRPPPAHPSDPAALQRVVPNVTIEARGGHPWRGDVDLGATIDRILAGQAYPSRNDGSVFQNREGRLPKRPGGYYREYVHPTDGVRGPGPQRIVRGAGGEWYYTPDHYGSFIPLHGPRGP